MKTKRALLAAMLALLLCVTALPAAYAEGETEIDYASLYMYTAKDMPVTLYIAPEWQSIAIAPTNAIFPDETSNYAPDGSLATGSVIFTYLPEPDAVYAAESYESAQALARESGIGIAGIVRYPVNGKPEDAGLQGYEYRELISFEDYKIAVAWVDAAAYAQAPAETLPILDALVASFRDSDDYLLVNTADGSFSHFHATNLDGEEYTFERLGDAKVTLVNAWATFCSPCLAEMPDLGELAAEYADRGFQIVGIPIDIFAADGSVDPNQLALAKQIVERTKANYAHLIADAELLAGPLSTVQYVPSSWFVDSEGNILGEMLVGGLSKSDWATEIEKHLAEAE